MFYIYFYRLIQCKIEPYIIMDGGHPIDREKFATLHMRMSSQLEICLQIDPTNQHTMKVFPLLARSLFVNVAQRLNIVVIQSDFEADDDIVIIAKELNAFVLSNDSDFFLFDVPFILLNSLNFKSIQKETKKNGKNFKYIPCYKFNAKIFSQVSYFIFFTDILYKLIRFLSERGEYY